MSYLKRVGALVVALLFALVLSPSQSALAETTQPPVEEGSNAVGACLDADQVWLLVVDVAGEVMANQCVGTPASGEAALLAGGITIEKDSGFICGLSGHPDPCPTTFDGSYWNYNYATAGTAWTFSQEGADVRVPSPGDIEAWCYNAPGTESCAPPLLTIMSGGEQVLVADTEAADYFDPALTGDAAETATETDADTDTDSTTESDADESGTPWALIGTGAVIALGAVGFLVWRSRSGKSGTQVGGR